ncbi:MAG: FAD-dependent oxidoreductase, partial [Verrucomicrobia bacterium]|nr:FAD-dependent oxidoreductase [Verrucomicrobiota bacterium]
YNYRFCVTKDPANRILLTAPPPGYNREEYVHYNRKSIATNAGPNHKSHMNSPILPGENHDYPEADWLAREKIIARHLNFGLGLMYFLQNDESVPPKQREKFREWGLPKDEFADNNHVPYEMYVREARRIVGRHVYTEHDNSLAPGLGRTPVHPDSIAVTDWYMDSHACTTDSRPGFHYDGKLILTEESRPGQIPYRSLLPQGVDNLLVPVCLSATHIAWGAVRLEPVWTQTGEAAGFAAALARKQKTTPAKLDPDLLLRTLVERRQMVSFFNDISVADKQPWIPAVQYFGTKGFFDDYNALPDKPLTLPVAEQWACAFAALAAGKLDATAEAKKLHALDQTGPAVTTAGFVKLIGTDDVRRAMKNLQLAPDELLKRGNACRLLYEAAPKK